MSSDKIIGEKLGLMKMKMKMKMKMNFQWREWMICMHIEENEGNDEKKRKEDRKKDRKIDR